MCGSTRACRPRCIDAGNQASLFASVTACGRLSQSISGANTTPSSIAINMLHRLHCAGLKLVPRRL
jgi:hypothetical protein